MIYFYTNLQLFGSYCRKTER